MMLTVQLHINAGSNNRKAKVRDESRVGGVIKGIKYIRIVIKMLKKRLGLTQRLFCSLITAWQVYPLKDCICREIS